VVPVEEVGLELCVWPFKAWITIGGTQAWLEGVIWILQLCGQEHRVSCEGVHLFNIEWQSRVGIQMLELRPHAAVLVQASLGFWGIFCAGSINSFSLSSFHRVHIIIRVRCTSQIHCQVHSFSIKLWPRRSNKVTSYRSNLTAGA